MRATDANRSSLLRNVRQLRTGAGTSITRAPKRKRSTLKAVHGCKSARPSSSNYFIPYALHFLNPWYRPMPNISRSANTHRQLMHRILQLVLRLGKLLLNRTFVLQNLLKPLLWIRRHCGILKGLLDGKSSYGTRDGAGASLGLPYAKETPLSGIRSVGRRGSEDIQNIHEACSPHVSYPSTSSAVPGMVGVTDAIACQVDPSSSQLSLQGPATDSHELEQDITDSPGPLPDPQDILLSPGCQAPIDSETQSFSHQTLRPFMPENLKRYERNVKM